MLKEKEVSQIGTKIAFHNKINYESLEVDLKWLTGRILTVIDGAIANEKQNKAIKDQIKNEVRNLLNNYQCQCSDGNSGHSIHF